MFSTIFVTWAQVLFKNIFYIIFWYLQFILFLSFNFYTGERVFILINYLNYFIFPASFIWFWHQNQRCHCNCCRSSHKWQREIIVCFCCCTDKLIRLRRHNFPINLFYCMNRFLEHNIYWLCRNHSKYGKFFFDQMFLLRVDCFYFFERHKFIVCVILTIYLH